MERCINGRDRLPVRAGNPLTRGAFPMLALRVFRYVWAAPYSALGLALGVSALLSGASMRMHSGALEFGGGRIGKLVSHLPPPFRFSAITFGHVVLGIDHATLAQLRTHEQVHVR